MKQIQTAGCVLITFLIAVPMVEAQKVRAPKQKTSKQTRSYRNESGRIRTAHSATPGAWNLSARRTPTERHAHKITSVMFERRTPNGRALYDGKIDGKAMKELIRMGKRDGLITRDRHGTLHIRKFLDAMRPFQLDFTQSGATELRGLQKKAGDRTSFFEVKSMFGGKGPWSDSLANQLVGDRIRKGERRTPRIDIGREVEQLRAKDPLNHHVY